MTKIKKRKKRFYIYELGIEIPSAHSDEPPPAAVSWERRHSTVADNHRARRQSRVAR